MSWSDVGKTIAKYAPIAAGVLTGGASTAVSAVGALVASAVGSDSSADDTMKKIQGDPAAYEKLKQMELDNKTQLTQLHLQAATNQQAQINKTIRAEEASNDAYVRRWRPTYGYMVSLSWFVQMSAFSFALAYTICKNPANLPAVVGSLTAAFGALAALWGIALSVLGINISSRSKDKQVAAGQVPASGILGALAQRLAKGKNG